MKYMHIHLSMCLCFKPIPAKDAAGGDEDGKEEGYALGHGLFCALHQDMVFFALCIWPCKYLEQASLVFGAAAAA